jgi:hypothetical protein
MNRLLWVLQSVLAALFGIGGATKVVMFEQRGLEPSDAGLGCDPGLECVGDRDRKRGPCCGHRRRIGHVRLGRREFLVPHEHVRSRWRCRLEPRRLIGGVDSTRPRSTSR